MKEREKENEREREKEKNEECLQEAGPASREREVSSKAENAKRKRRQQS